MAATAHARALNPPSPAAFQARPVDLPRISSQDLLRGGNLILIEHGHDRYVLRMTRNNKLILTK
jgi:hemin uptake protein HemP